MNNLEIKEKLLKLSDNEVGYLDKEGNFKVKEIDKLNESFLTETGRTEEMIIDAFKNSKSQRWVNDTAIVKVLKKLFREKLLDSMMKNIDSKIKEDVKPAPVNVPVDQPKEEPREFGNIESHSTLQKDSDIIFRI